MSFRLGEIVSRREQFPDRYFSYTNFWVKKTLESRMNKKKLTFGQFKMNKKSSNMENVIYKSNDTST